MSYKNSPHFSNSNFWMFLLVMSKLSSFLRSNILKYSSMMSCCFLIRSTKSGESTLSTSTFSSIILINLYLKSSYKNTIILKIWKRGSFLLIFKFPSFSIALLWSSSYCSSSSYLMSSSFSSSSNCPSSSSSLNCSFWF